jgi:glycosyltransferase involved in cell wall biosynthesis
MGGAERMLSRLVVASQRRGMEHCVISLKDRGSYGDDIISSGARVHELKQNPSISALAAIPRLTSLLRQEKPDVLMTWLYHADLLGTAAGFLANVPRLYWNLRCSDMDFSSYSWSTGLLVKILAASSKRPDAIVANSNAGRKVHQKLGYRPRTWLEIPNGFDLEQLLPSPTARGKLYAELNIPGDALVVGNVARLDPMKDHATLLDAFAQVARTNLNAHFVLAGLNVTAKTPAIARAGALPELAGRIHALGIRSDVPDLLPAFDLYVQSSAFGEGFPNVVGEAMACGVPAVVTDVGDAAAIVDDTSRIVAPGNAVDLAKAISDFLNQAPESRRKAGQDARERIALNYRLEDIVATYEALFEGVDAP